MSEKKVERVCCACAQTKDRKLLIKITKNHKTNEIRVNPDSKFLGRSVYICNDKKCADSALKKNRIFKILKTKPDDSLKEKINAVLET